MEIITLANNNHNYKLPEDIYFVYKCYSPMFTTQPCHIIIGHSFFYKILFFNQFI